jgi:hypothetical protein
MIRQYAATFTLLMFVLALRCQAATTVNAGSVSNVTGPGSLNLTNVVYAVNFNGPSLTVNGVNFSPDNTPPPGFSSVGPQLVTAWQTKPEFGATTDDNNLEQIYHDIRWTQDGFNPPLQANMDVTPGQMYRLQILFYGNNPEARGWDIGVEGALVVDNITSLGVDTGSGPPPYSPNLGLVYSYDFVAPDNQVNVQMGQLGGLGPELIDRNAIWAGITLSQIPEPATPLLAGVAMLGLLRRRRVVV